MINNEIDQKIQTSIDSLVKFNYDKCAEQLQSLAKDFASVGLSIETFIDIKTYIIENAKNKVDTSDLVEKLKLAEKSLTKKRKENGRPKTKERSKTS